MITKHWELIAEDYHTIGTKFDLWIIRKKSNYGLPKPGEIPAIGDTASIFWENEWHRVLCDDVQISGDSEFNWYPHYIIKHLNNPTP